MPLVAARGISHHVQEVGAGPTVVMVHGLLIGSVASWYFTAAPALAAEHRVRVYDLRGHGRSERAPSGYSTRELAADLAALTDDLREPFDLVGHSWGALVALQYALAHPTRVRRLALVEAPLPPAGAIEQLGFSVDDRELATRLIDALPASLRDAVTGGRRQATRLLASLSFLVGESTLLADLRGEPDVDDASLAALRVPTLLAYGDRSSCRPAGERLARALPDATLVVLAGGHYLHLDARAELAAALVEFCAPDNAEVS